MGYIEKNLMKDERVIYEAKLHPISYTLPILFMLVAFGIGVAFPPMLIMTVIVVGICSVWCVEIHGGRQFVLTSKRVIVKKGIIERKVRELMLRKCEGIQVEQSILGRILNYGTLLVTTGEATNRYKKIKDPITFSTRINEQIDELRGNS